MLLFSARVDVMKEMNRFIENARRTTMKTTRETPPYRNIGPVLAVKFWSYYVA